MKTTEPARSGWQHTLILFVVLLSSIGVSLLLCGISSAQAEDSATPITYDINTVLMEATFRIHGAAKGKPGQISFGTAFLMGKPHPDDNTKAFYVLISAAHVFAGIEGDNATITLRVRQPDGRYLERPWPIELRRNGEELFVRHAEADVSALYVNMPDDFAVTILPTALLANDDVLKKFEIHPGDELFCLGFPLLAQSPMGFPILRSGKIASYPLVPTSIHKSILFDFRVFEGNSGGPVYFVDRDRTYGGNVYLGQKIQFVVGLVTSQLMAPAFNNQALQIASVVPAPFIRETIDLLPKTSPYP